MSDPKALEPTPSTTEAPPRMPRGALLFCLLLLIIGAVYLTLALRRMYLPRGEKPVPMATYDVADEAKKYLRQTKAEPLSPSLEKVLEEARQTHFDSYKHPL